MGYLVPGIDLNFRISRYGLNICGMGSNEYELMETPPHKLQGLKDLAQTFWCQTPHCTFGRVFFVVSAPTNYIGFRQHEETPIRSRIRV